MKEAKISVVIPSYNAVKFIEATIQSILQQDYPNSECIVMDGGSDDGTLEVLRRYEQHITWVSEPDKGQSDAINKGIRQASGDIIAYICADDAYEKDCFRKVADFFASNLDAMWVCGLCRIIDQNGLEIRRTITRYKSFWQRRYSYNKLLILDFIPQPAVFWRKDLVHEIGLFDTDEHLAMDYEYWLRAGAKHDPGFIDEYLARFRVRADSKSTMHFARQAREALSISRKYARSEGRAGLAPLQYLNYLLVVAGYSVMGLGSRPGAKGREPVLS